MKQLVKIKAIFNIRVHIVTSTDDDIAYTLCSLETDASKVYMGSLNDVTCKLCIALLD